MSATQGNKVNSIINAFVCPNPDWQLQQDNMNWFEEAIPISFGPDASLGTYFAMVVTNSLLLAGCAAVHLAVVGVVYRVRLRTGYEDKSLVAAMSVCRFPSYLMLPSLFFYQTIVGSSIICLVYSPGPGPRIAGAVAMVIVGFGLPIFTFTVLGPGFRAIFYTKDMEEELQRQRRRVMRLKSISSGDAEAIDDIALTDEPDPAQKEPPSAFSRFINNFRGNGHWRVETDKHWCLRYHMFFTDFRKGFQWYLGVEMGTVFVLGVCDGIQPSTVATCRGRTGAYVAIFCFQWIVLTVARPFNNRFANMFYIVAYWMQFMTMLFVAIAIYRSDLNSSGVTTSVYLLIIITGMLLLKAVVDALIWMNETFQIEKFFQRRLRRTVQQTHAADEDRFVENITKEMTALLLKREDERRQSTLKYAISGIPEYVGETLLEADQRVARENFSPYSPRKYLAKYRGPEGTDDVDSEEERIIREHEATSRSEHVHLCPVSTQPPHIVEQGIVRAVTRIDKRFEILLEQARERAQPSLSHATSSVKKEHVERAAHAALQSAMQPQQKVEAKHRVPLGDDSDDEDEML
jgi:hypothetical protein